MLSKKGLLDLTSTKKHDTMRLYDPNTPANQFFSMPRGTNSYLWCPTARSRANENLTNVRNNSTVYYKGLSERLELSPSGGKTWKWRRLVFSMKGFKPTNAFFESSEGVLRIWRTMPIVDQEALSNLVFKGELLVDFSTPFTGQVDTNRVKIHYDKTRVLSNGNQNAYLRNPRHWIPLEKNFRYDEDENGDEYRSSVWAAPGNHNLGDVFVWDIFADVGADTGDSLTVRSGTTIYWHEK